MVGVTTVALLERKPGMSRDLFSRYWRDVHGVMAARIPGFESYTQYHVTPLVADGVPFEGIAIVTFASEEDRQGLATSAMTGHIHRDEANLFRRALLYNLTVGADRALLTGDGERQYLFVTPHGADEEAILGSLRDAGATRLATYDLRTGDPAAWNNTDVDDSGRGRRFVTLIHAGWAGEPAPAAVLGILELGALGFAVSAVHVMVEGGRATPVGLRGFDALQTIIEAGADNQLDPLVENAVYGLS